MNHKVLFVDDDQNILAAACRNFQKRYEVDTASGGAQALRAMEDHGPYAVVVADMAMPGMNGIEFLKRAQDLAPDTIRIMFTGHPGPITLREAINSGQVFRFISKPCPPEELARAVDDGLLHYRMVTLERELLETTLARSIEAMTGMLDVLEPETSSYARVLADRAGRVARALGARDAGSITLAALFSPLWILSLPPEARTRAGEGDPLEAQVLAAATAKAADLIQPIPRLEDVGYIIRSLGAGADLPRGEAPLGTRILKTLLDFGAIEARVKSREVALEELRLRGDTYDPAVLAALAGIFGLPLHSH